MIGDRCGHLSTAWLGMVYCHRHNDVVLVLPKYTDTFTIDQHEHR